MWFGALGILCLMVEFADAKLVACSSHPDGYCVDFTQKDCPPGYIRSFSGCNFREACCYPKPEPVTTSTPKHDSDSHQTPHKPNCGVPATNPHTKIVGGEITDILSYPWMAAVLVKDKYHCGASIISDQWILTAAHCMDDSPSAFSDEEISVLVGSSRVDHFSHSHKHSIARRVLHPKYFTGSSKRDIALLKLSKSLDTGNDVTKPICLPEVGDNFDSQVCVVTGWGSIYERGPHQDELRAVSLTVHNQTTCSFYMGHVFQPIICAGHLFGGKDACGGDSGGPLVCQSHEGAWTQAGIVSKGRGCARPNKLAFYTDVAAYRKWIDGVMKEDGL